MQGILKLVSERSLKTLQEVACSLWTRYLDLINRQERNIHNPSSKRAYQFYNSCQ